VDETSPVDVLFSKLAAQAAHGKKGAAQASVLLPAVSFNENGPKHQRCSGRVWSGRKPKLMSGPGGWHSLAFSQAVSLQQLEAALTGCS